MKYLDISVSIMLFVLPILGAIASVVVLFQNTGPQELFFFLLVLNLFGCWAGFYRLTNCIRQWF